MIDKRAPYPGDVLLDPPRMVTWVNVDRREFRCTPLVALPPEYAPAPIEDGWRDMTNLTVPEDYARAVETFDPFCCAGCGCADGEAHREGCPSLACPECGKPRGCGPVDCDICSATGPARRVLAGELALDALEQGEAERGRLSARLHAAEMLLERWRAAVKTSHPDIWSDTDLFLGS